jgi:hypothetical protein
VRHLVEVEEIEEKDVPVAGTRSKGYTVVKAAKKTGKKEPDGDET